MTSNDRSSALALLFVLSFFAGCASTPAPALRVDDGSLYERMQQASATVLKDGRIAGSGSFVSDQGHFLTAAHVLEGMEDRIELVLPDHSVQRASIIARDLGSDTALLRLDGGLPAGVRWLPLAPDAPKAGQTVYVFGAPAMVRGLLLPGMVARDRTGFNRQGEHDCYLHSLNVIADTPPGISGGCWVDASGSIVGVQCSHIGSDAASTGMAYIAPLAAIHRLVRTQTDQPATTLGAELPGLWTQSHGFTKRFPPGTTGVAVHRFKENSPLEAAGVPLEAAITHADGVNLNETADLIALIRRKRPGDRVSLTVVTPDTHVVKVYAVVLGELRW